MVSPTSRAVFLAETARKAALDAGRNWRYAKRVARKTLRAEMGTSALLGHKAADRLTDNDPLSPVDEGRNSGQK